MVVTASSETYCKVIEYGVKKTKLRITRLILQAFMAGVYVGMAGHCCTCFAGSWNSADTSAPNYITPGLQKFLYASIFPLAFVSIILTGAELFTGNTMTMLICLFERRVSFLQLCINWLSSLIGNWLGTLATAYILSFLTGAITGDVEKYVVKTIIAKTSYDFGQCFVRGIGCNTFVCLAVWFVIACDDAAGKILALWFPIVAFVLGGYEHIIANLYTLQMALMVGGSDVTVGDVIVKNLIPTLLGNLVGGCFVVGAVYWYNFYPTMTVTEREDPKGSQNPTYYDIPRKSMTNLDALNQRSSFGGGVRRLSFGGECHRSLSFRGDSPWQANRMSFSYASEGDRRPGEEGVGDLSPRGSEGQYQALDRRNSTPGNNSEEPSGRLEVRSSFSRPHRESFGGEGVFYEDADQAAKDSHHVSAAKNLISNLFAKKRKSADANAENQSPNNYKHNYKIKIHQKTLSKTHSSPNKNVEAPKESSAEEQKPGSATPEKEENELENKTS